MGRKDQIMKKNTLPFLGLLLISGCHAEKPTQAPTPGGTADLSQKGRDLLPSTEMAFQKSNLAIVEVLPCSENITEAQDMKTEWCVSPPVPEGQTVTTLQEDGFCTATIAQATKVETAIDSREGSRIINISCGVNKLATTLAIVGYKITRYARGSVNDVSAIKRLGQSILKSEEGTCSDIASVFSVNERSMAQVLRCTCETDDCGSEFYEIVPLPK